MLLESIRNELVKLHLELPKNNLVTWTSGNVSIRDQETGLVVIKPSGIMYEDLRAEHFVVLDVNGKVVEGSLKPSSDTASHLYIYRHRPDVFGVVHTHSPYATAFAAIGKPIPVYLTAQADEFGGPIPCAGFGLIGGEDIGKLVVENIGASPGLPAQEPRRLHHRPQRERRGQGRRHGRGCRAHHLDRPPAWPAGRNPAPRWSRSCTTATRTSTGSNGHYRLSGAARP